MSASSPPRNAAGVLPLPVGASMRTSSPERMSGQPSVWARVGPPGKVVSNHRRTAGWKRSMPASERIARRRDREEEVAALERLLDDRDDRRRVLHLERRLEDELVFLAVLLV